MEQTICIIWRSNEDGKEDINTKTSLRTLVLSWIVECILELDVHVDHVSTWRAWWDGLQLMCKCYVILGDVSAALVQHYIVQSKIFVKNAFFL
jgi:hypothetical protein